MHSDAHQTLLLRHIAISAGIRRGVMMSGKRRHQQGIARREALEERDLLAARERGVPVNPGELAPYNSYGTPEFVARGFYSDRPFDCEDCGKPQVWTAEQQKWWYEVAKGYVYSVAKLCRPCRQARRRGGDPHRYKSVGQLLSRVRSELEPRLAERGFHFVGRGPQVERQARFGRALPLEFARGDDLLSISWDQHEASLAADLLGAGGDDLGRIAAANFDRCRSTAAFDSRIDEFVRDVDFRVAPPADDADDRRDV